MPSWLSKAYSSVFGKAAKPAKSETDEKKDEEEKKDEKAEDPPWDEDEPEDDDADPADDKDKEDEKEAEGDDLEDEDEKKDAKGKKTKAQADADPSAQAAAATAARATAPAGRGMGDRREFARMTKRFGPDFAARVYGDGLSYTQALERHDRLMAARVNELEKRLASLGEAGEKDPPKATLAQNGNADEEFVDAIAQHAAFLAGKPKY